MAADLEQLLDLSLPEKLQLVESLWDSIVPHSDSVPVTEWQKDELARRKEEYLRDPDSAVSWEVARARLLGQGRD